MKNLIVGQKITAEGRDGVLTIDSFSPDEKTIYCHSSAQPGIVAVTEEEILEVEDQEEEGEALTAPIAPKKEVKKEQPQTETIISADGHSTSENIQDSKPTEDVPTSKPAEEIIVPPAKNQQQHTPAKQQQGGNNKNQGNKKY